MVLPYCDGSPPRVLPTGRIASRAPPVARNRLFSKQDFSVVNQLHLKLTCCFGGTALHIRMGN
jgi:hypothetical protein